MPAIGHIIFGFAFLIPIMYYSKDKFSYKVAFIFLANNYIGPDAAQIWIGLPFHSLLGFLIFAIPLSLFYSYFTRFSLVMGDKGFKFVDEEIREVNWKNSYCLVAAGGICHFFNDQFYHLSQRLYIWPGVTLSYDTMLTWGGEAYHVVNPLMLISYVIIIGSILLSFYTLKKGYKETFKLFVIVIGLTMLSIFTLGVETVGGERDLGVIFHSVVYIFLPLSLLLYAAKDVRDNPNTTPDEPRINRALLLNIIALISTLFAATFFVIAIIGITTPEFVAELLPSSLTEDFAEVASTIQLLGILILIISSTLLTASIGLFLKINICRKIVIGICTGLLIIAFPFAIALFLNEKQVKEMFVNEKDVKEVFVKEHQE